MGKENKVKRMLFLHRLQDLFSAIESSTKNARKITLYCSNFNLDSNIGLESWLKNHFLMLKNIEIEIYNYNNINQKNMNNDIKNYKNIHIYNKQNDTSNILFNFVKQLNDGKNINNLSESINKFLKQKDSFEKLQSCIKNNLQKPIIEKLLDFKEIEFFGSKEQYKESLNLAFDNLIKDIKNIYEEGNAQTYKEIVNFFFSIFNIFEIKKIFSKNIALFAIDAIFEGSRTLNNILEWADSRYCFAISNSIIKLFVQDIAPIILLFENRILNYTIIIDSRILIELSGFRRDIIENEAYIKQNLALLIELQQASLSTIEGINLNYDYGNETLQICGKENIASHLSAQITSNNNRFVFIESPYFNSSKLVQLMKNEQKSEIKAPSAQGYNYLIISNAPYKHNAGLNHKLLEELGNAINYKNKINNDNLFTNPKKDYDVIIDYSKYEISIKDEIAKSYVVSLSPFIFIPQEKYSDFKNAKEELDRLYSNISNHYNEDINEIEAYNNFKEKNKNKILNFNFIQSFFQQENNKAYFLKQEKKYFKESIQCLQNYIDSIIFYANDYKIPQKFESKKDYSILEMLLLALTYYVIKNFYTSIKTDTQQWWHLFSQYESINIGGESIKMLPYESFLALDDRKISLCFSNQRKNELLKNGEVFCIEEFILELENQQDEIDINGILEEFFNKKDCQNEFEKLDENNQGNLEILEAKIQELEKTLQNKKSKESLKAGESLQIIIEHFITSFFPFAKLFFNLSPFNLNKKLVKLLISYKMKHLKEALFEELGLAYLAYILYSHNMEIHIQNKNKMLEKKFKQLKKKSFIQAIKQHSVVISQKNHQDLKYYKNIFLKDYTKATIKNFFKSIPQVIGLNIFNQVFITHYEKSKKEFERLQFIKFSYKYHPPYVLKRQNEGVFYPMLINNTFLSFNFINMIIGGRLQTGAFGDIDSLFYCYEDIKTTNTRNYLLNKLLAYLCLDELRGMNDSLISLNDIEFFNTRTYTQDLPTRPRYLKLIHDEGEFQAPQTASEQIKINIARFNQKMQSINANEKRQALYEEYKAMESKNIQSDSTAQLLAIDAYHIAMNYLDDIYMNCFNTNLKNNTPNLQKHREFLRALNIIGENNIKSLYVGINQKRIQKGKEQINRDIINEDDEFNNDLSTQQKRPKFIGRLATTIIMKNGLFIG